MKKNDPVFTYLILMTLALLLLSYGPFFILFIILVFVGILIYLAYIQSDAYKEKHKEEWAREKREYEEQLRKQAAERKARKVEEIRQRYSTYRGYYYDLLVKGEMAQRLFGCDHTKEPWHEYVAWQIAYFKFPRLENEPGYCIGKMYINKCELFVPDIKQRMLHEYNTKLLELGVFDESFVVTPEIIYDKGWEKIEAEALEEGRRITT